MNNLRLVSISSLDFFQDPTHTQVVPCHYDVKSGELLPTEALPTVPGAPTGVDGQTFAAAIRISGRDVLGFVLEFFVGCFF